MKRLLFPLACLSMLPLWAPSPAAARPPTAGRLQLGAGIAYTDPLEGRTVDPYRYGLSVRTGFTLNNGLYIGGLADLHLGEDTEVDGEDRSNTAHLLGAVLGFDLKLAITVAARLSVAAGLHRLSLSDGGEADSNLFVGPGLDLVLNLGDHFYLGPAARISFVLGDNGLPLATWSMTVGASL